uniref:Mannose-6-phosphate class i n=1 Tax=Colletotrichum fructicola (strain Nara gc5) TaxID=1213859 RepID=L2FKY0_COLFN
MAPIVFPANQPPARFYLGGPQISSFRSDKPSGPNEPEDWIASTTYCLGCARSKLGMTVLPDGRLLADAIAADPEYWLGPGPFRDGHETARQAARRAAEASGACAPAPGLGEGARWREARQGRGLVSPHAGGGVPGFEGGCDS